MEMHSKVMGHLLDSLAEKVDPLTREGFLKTIESEIMNERIAVPKGM